MPKVQELPSDGLDACGLARLAETAREEAVPVFPGDSTDIVPVATLVGGRMVWLCESSEEAGMSGSVYSDDLDADCAVSSPMLEARPYIGPCDRGWIKSDLISLEAG